jgi:hypothetical protein
MAEHTYAVHFEDGHNELVQAPSAIDAAKAAKRAYGNGQHRVLRVLLGLPSGEEG